MYHRLYWNTTKKAVIPLVKHLGKKHLFYRFTRFDTGINGKEIVKPLQTLCIAESTNNVPFPLSSVFAGVARLRDKPADKKKRFFASLIQ